MTCRSSRTWPDTLSEPTPIRLTGWYDDWDVEIGQLEGNPRTRLAEWCSGVPALGGAEDARSWLYPLAAHEGMTGNHFQPGDPQHPKIPALGFLGALIRELGIFKPSPVHPLHIIDVNGHLFATVPGEPTVMAAWQIERTLRRATGAKGISVLGYAGDYASYFTTTEEFKRQYYEGASTIYGSESTNHLSVRLARLTRGPAWRRPRALTAAFHMADVQRQPTPHIPLHQQAILLPRGLRLIQIWEAADAPQAPPAPGLWRVWNGQRHRMETTARVWSTEEQAPAGARMMWIAEWDLEEDTAGSAWLASLTPLGDHRADVVAINTTVSPEALQEPAPILESTREDSGMAAQYDVIEQLLAERPDAVGFALAEMIPDRDVHGYDEAVRLAEESAPALLAGHPAEEAAPGTPAILPDDFSFPGYDPDAIPVDPSSRRFESLADMSHYIARGGIAYHTNTLRKDPRRCPGDFASGLKYKIAAPTPGRPTEVAIFGDFANGLYMPRYIARGMLRQAQQGGLDAAIHLGDVYYGGTREEFDQYMEEPLQPLYPTTPVFTLPGNHDMYSGGGEFHRYLDRKRDRHPSIQVQEAACFCVDAGPFRIVGADTQWWRHARLSTDVQSEVTCWLREGRRNGQTTLLCTSHHGWDFGKAGRTRLLKVDLHNIVGERLVDLWFWGNVHHAALYEPEPVGGYVASCVGWSGFPYHKISPEAEGRCEVPVRWAEYGTRFHPWPDLRPDRGNNGWLRVRLFDDLRLELVYLDWMGHERHRATVIRDHSGVRFAD